MENSVLTGKPYNIGYALSGGFIKGFAHLGRLSNDIAYMQTLKQLYK